MHLGELDRLVVIEKFTGSFDAYNYESKSWATHVSPWAKRESKSGNEDYESNELTATRKTNYVIRYDSTVTEKMRVLDNSQYFEILAIEYIDRDCFMRLICERKDSKML